MPQPVGQSSAAPLHRNACPHRMESLPASNVTPAHIRRNPSRAPQRARNEMMLLDILFTLFLTHVGSLTTVKSNQRRFAPTPAHIAGIKCPHHRNKHIQTLWKLENADCSADWFIQLSRLILTTPSRRPTTSSPKPSHCSANGPWRIGE